jgi:hypothetical protein
MMGSSIVDITLVDFLDCFDLEALEFVLDIAVGDDDEICDDGISR